MSFKYLYELNGVDLQDVSIGSTAVEKLEEPLDEASLRLPFTVRNYEYEMLGYLKITIEDKDLERIVLEFLVVSDDVSEGSKYGDFIHELTLVEYTHKYDKYMVHTLSKTKALKDENPAKFLYNESLVMNFPVGSAFPRRFVQNIWIPPIDIKTTYYNDEAILIPQVEQGFQATSDGVSGGKNFSRVDVYLKVNSTRFVLSSSGTSITLAEGDYEIEYGFVGVTNDYTIPTGDVWLYKFQIRIIDRERISVLDLLNLLRDNISKYGGIESKLYFDNTRMFNINPSIEDYLASVEVPQTYIQKATLRQVLNSIFLYVNAISRLYNDGPNKIDILSMDDFNKIVGDFEASDISGFHTSQESNDLASKGVSWLERVLPDNRERANVVQPSGNQYQTVRSDNIQITQDKFGLELARTLYEPKRFVKHLDKLTIKDTSNYDSYEYPSYDIDLSPRFINKQEWGIKEYTTNFPAMDLQYIFGSTVGLRENKTGNIYWERGQTYIELSQVFGELFQATLIQNVIREALHEQITRKPPRPFILEIVNEDTSITEEMLINYEYNVDGITYLKANTYDTNVSFNDLDWRAYKFNLEYITEENTTVEVEREDLSYLDYYSELRQNQSDKLINVELASRKSYGDLQRSGVPNKTFQKFHTDLSTLYTVGMQDSNGFVITKRKLELHNNYILATYNATKDHNRLSQFIGVQQAFRAFEIPTSSQVYERIEPYRDYVLIHEPSKSFGNEITKIYTDNTMELLFGNLINDWQDTLTSGKTRVTGGYIRTDKFLEKYPDGTYKYAISTPVNAFGKKGGLVFQFGFKNNQIAVSTVEEVDNGGAINRYNKAVRYTDDLGRMNEMWFQLSREYDINLSDSLWTEKETLDNYPLVRTNKATFGSLNEIIFRSGNSSMTHQNYDALIITKDKSQSIVVPYQLNVIAYDYNTYVIGQEFYNENLLVKNPKVVDGVVVGKKTYVYLYNPKTPYGIFDDLKIKSGYASKIELVNGVNVQITTSVSGNRLEFLSPLLWQVTTSFNWAIGDDVGNLYLASNKNVNGFKFTKKHFRPELLEIGRLRDNVDIQILDFDMVAGLDLSYVRGTTLVDNVDTLLVGGFDLAYVRGTELLSDIDVALGGALDMTHIRGSTVVNDLDVLLGGGFDLQYWRTIDIGGDLDTALVSNIDLVYQRGTELQQTLDVALPTSFDLQYIISTIGEGSILGSVDGMMMAGLDLSYYRTTDIGADLDIEGVANLELNYWRTKDIGDTLDYTLISNLDLVYQRGTTLLGDLDSGAVANIDLDYFITRNIGMTFDSVLTANFNLVYTSVDFQWLSGGTTPVGRPSCALPSDVGNVRCDLVPSSCSWDMVGGQYISATDQSDNVGSSCLIENAKQTVCTLLVGRWYCQDYVANITGYDYDNCEICSEVERV